MMTTFLVKMLIIHTPGTTHIASSVTRTWRLCFGATAAAVGQCTFVRGPSAAVAGPMTFAYRGVRVAADTDNSAITLCCKQDRWRQARGGRCKQLLFLQRCESPIMIFLMRRGGSSALNSLLSCEGATILWLCPFDHLGLSMSPLPSNAADATSWKSWMNVKVGLHQRLYDSEIKCFGVSSRLRRTWQTSNNNTDVSFRACSQNHDTVEMIWLDDCGIG